MSREKEEMRAHKAIQNAARTATQDFVENNITTVQGIESAVPATTVLAIEAFGLAVALYASERHINIEDALEEYLEGVSTAGAFVARSAYEYLENGNKKVKSAKQETDNIIKGIFK